MNLQLNLSESFDVEFLRDMHIEVPRRKEERRERLSGTEITLTAFGAAITLAWLAVLIYAALLILNLAEVRL